VGLAEHRIVDRRAEVLDLEERTVGCAPGFEKGAPKSRVRDASMVRAREEHPALDDNRKRRGSKIRIVIIRDESDPLGGRIARRIEDDDVETLSPPPRLRKPREHVAHNQSVPPAPEHAGVFEVDAAAFDGGQRDVDADRTFCTTERGRHCECAGVGEQVGD
jgi:hypothetical protein